MSIESVIRGILTKNLGTDAEALSPDTPVRALPAADSLKMLSVILEVEKYFDIEIPDDATFRIETIGEFEVLVKQLVTEKAGAEPTAAPAETRKEPLHVVQ
jgi:acyl carrier protein